MIHKLNPEQLIWHHKALGLVGDYAVTEEEHAPYKDECPLCLEERRRFKMKYEMGEIIHHYAACQYADCKYVTEDYQSKEDAIEEIEDHWLIEHDDDVNKD